MGTFLKERCKKVALTGSGVMGERDGRIILVFNRAFIILVVNGRSDEREDGVNIFTIFPISATD